MTHCDCGQSLRVQREVEQSVPESFEPGPWVITYLRCDCGAVYITQRSGKTDMQGTLFEGVIV